VGEFGVESVRLAEGLYACGDHREHPSLNGALASGRRAAEAVLADS
jgi:predicted NAD/FAD-dependent oxidoreductase